MESYELKPIVDDLEVGDAAFHKQGKMQVRTFDLIAPFLALDVFLFVLVDSLGCRKPQDPPPILVSLLLHKCSNGKGVHTEFEKVTVLIFI